MSNFRFQHHGISAGLFVLAMSACSSDKVIGVRHNPPSVQIVEPSDGSLFFAFEPVSFLAEVEVLGSESLTDIQHQWVARDTIVCDWQPVPSDGFPRCPIVFDDNGTYSVTITVKDPRLDTATSTVNVEIISNKAPSITIVTPPDDSFFAPDDVIELTAMVSDEEDSGEQLRVVGTSDIDGDLGFTAIPSTSGDWASNIDGLSSGTHLIELTVTDTVGQSAIDRVTLTVNGKPDAPTVRIIPDPTESGERLTAQVITDSVDPEDDPVTYGYQWFRDGVTFAGDGVSAVIPSGVTKRDEFWEVIVTARDPYGSGEPGNASITIGNSPPSVESVSIVPFTPTTTDNLTALATGWFDQDDDPENYLYEWEVNGLVDPAERGDLFPYEKTARGDNIRVTITPLDDLAEGTPVSSSIYTVANTPPTAGGVTISPDEPEPLDELRCIIADSAIPTDVDDDDLTFVYTWYVDGVIAPEYTTVTPATMAVVSWGETGNGETWTCEVYADDGFDTGPVFSDSVYVADSSRPRPPEFNDSIREFRNQDSVDLTGECEAGCTLDFTCDDGDRVWDIVTYCTSSGTFSVTVEPLGRGLTTTCEGTCTDAAGNTSDLSEPISTTVCDPEDIYENGSYGDDIEDPIDEWPAIHDDGTDSYALIGNMLDDDDEDWFIITASDDVAEDIDDGLDMFRFAAEIVEGTGDFSFIVYRDSPDRTDSDSCMPDDDGYTEYSWEIETTDDGTFRGMPTGDLRQCATDSETLNACEDNTSDFYIQVFRKPSTSTSCNHYSISVTNGVW